MLSDIRFALRTLRRAPAFTLVAVLTLTLAVGSTTAVFSVVDAIVLRGLPYRDASRLQTVYERSDDGNLRVPSYPTFRDWQTQSAAVSDAIDGFAFIRGDGVKIDDNPDRQIAAFVTPGFFKLMGTPPVLGRGFLPDEETLGAAAVAVVSYDFFTKRFGGDRAILGKVIAIDSIPTTIIGVMPRGFAYPNFNGAGGWLPPAVWQPIARFEATHAALSLRGLHVDSRAILRLRAGSDSARAAVAMKAIAQRLAAEYPVEQAHWTSVGMRGLADELFGELWSTLLLIGGAIGLVLLLACANVANLMLVRSSARGQEFAVRAALGAGRWRIGRQLFVEAAVLAAAAGVLGVLLSAALVAATRPFAAERLPFATNIAVDPRAVLFTIGLTSVAALLVGVLPALQASRGNLIQRLRSGAASAGGRAELRARNGLVALQFALAITLLIGAGLLIQSVRRVSTVPLGYEPTDLITLAVAPPARKYDAPAQAAALYKRILDALSAVPSVQGVAIAGGALLSTGVEIEGQSGTGALPQASYHTISDDFLRVMRVPLVAGRGFTADDMRSPTGFLVSANLAKQLWPGTSAIGQRITVRRASQARADFGQPITMPVVGVVADYRQNGAEQKAPTQVFLPYTLEVWPWTHFVVRARGGEVTLAALERAVKSVEPAITFYGKPSFDQAGRVPSLADPRFFVTSLLSAFAGIALLLAAIGLYGVVAYGVAQRTREIGIRIAIGAPSRSIVTLLLRQATTFVFLGVGAGLIMATAATKLLQSMLFETATTDITTFIIVPAVLAVVAIAASCLPAFRATRTDPAIVIRAE